MPRSEESKKRKYKKDNQYVKDHYHRISLNVTPDKHKAIEKAAETNGESVSGYIKKAIDDRLNSSQ